MLATDARGFGSTAQARLLPFLWLLTSSLATSLRSIVNFVDTYAGPVGIANASWSFYFLYLAVDFVGVFAVYLPLSRRGMLHFRRPASGKNEPSYAKGRAAGNEGGWYERRASGVVKVASEIQ